MTSSIGPKHSLDVLKTDILKATTDAYFFFFAKGINCLLDRWKSSIEGESAKVCSQRERKGKLGAQ